MQIITFGRGIENNVIIDEQSVSRIHCQIIKHDNESFGIIDFSSTNGTFVNGKRITGEVLLNWNDAVQIGNVHLQWQQYFNQSKKKYNSTLGLSLCLITVVIIALILVFAFARLFNASNNNGKFLVFSSIGAKTNLPVVSGNTINIDGVTLNFDMEFHEIPTSNPNANIQKKIIPGYSNEVSSQEGYDYYLINNTVAVILNAGKIDRICLWTGNYETSRNVSIGSTWSEVVKAYPSAEFWALFDWYNYSLSRYENCFYIYDPTSCAGFIFNHSQFSQTQLNAFYEVVGGGDFDIEFYKESFSAVLYQSVFSSATVRQIVLGNCNYSGASANVTTVSKIDFTGLWRTLDSNFQLSLKQSREQIYGTTHSNDHGDDVNNVQYTLSGSVLDIIATVSYYSDYWEQNMKGRIKYIEKDKIEWTQIPQKGGDMPGKTILYRYASAQSGTLNKMREKLSDKGFRTQSKQAEKAVNNLLGSKWKAEVEKACDFCVKKTIWEFQDNNQVKITNYFGMGSSETNYMYKYFYDLEDRKWKMYQLNSVNNILKMNEREERDLAFKMGHFFILTLSGNKLIATDFAGNRQEYFRI